MFAEIILDVAINRPLDYSVPPQLIPIIRPGMRVKVPLKKAQQKGTVFTLKTTSAFTAVQPIIELLSETPYISEELFKLCQWMSLYYCCPLNKVIKSVLPPSIRQNIKHKEQLWIQSKLSAPQLLTYCTTLRTTHPIQANVLDVFLKAPTGMLLSELLEKTKTSKSPIQTLIKKEVLSCSKVQIERSPLEEYDYFQTQPKRLNSEQKNSLSQIETSLNQNQFATHLLFGVTGSGKTEIYLQAIDIALKQQKGIVFLVPEIALTSQTIERLRTRFTNKIAILHHRLSAGEKHDAWHQMHQGNISIVIGARSAVFSPIARLGLIIVDEEQESAYKQTDESPSYHARDVAIVRAKNCQATVILGTATPSFESYQNALDKKYHLSTLTKRPDDAQLPTIQIVDMKREYERAKQFTLFSNPLIKAIQQRLDLGEQTLLFLNRRGYNTSQICPACSHIIQCPHCEVSLTFHLNEQTLACHLCDYRLSPPPRTCAQCHSPQGLKFKGSGTQLVEKALHALFPSARILRLDADTTRHKGSHEMLFKQFKSGKADILIGTQMIAKGLHFPSVTLVGILNADSSLQIPDFRASEHVFQLLTQVSGRAGRGALPGLVIIQTKMPDHPMMMLASQQNYQQFFEQEIAMRKLFNYPPFSHLIKVIFSGKDAQFTQLTAQNWRTHLIAHAPPTCQLLPVVPSGHPKIKNLYRFQFLLKGEKMGQLFHQIGKLQLGSASSKKIRVHIDIDPLSTFF